MPSHWIYSALRLVLVAGTSALNRDTASCGQDVLLHAFLANTLQGGGLAAIRGGLGLCGPGVALSGSPAAIDEAQQAFTTAARADDLQVRRSVALAGPWSAPGYRLYRQSPDSGRWIPTYIIRPNNDLFNLLWLRGLARRGWLWRAFLRARAAA